VFPSHLLDLRAADGLRLQRDASSVEPGVGDDRRRPEQAGDLEHVAQGAQDSRWPLQVAGLRATGILVRWSSPGALDPRGRYQSRQPGPALAPVAEGVLRGFGGWVCGLS